MTASLTSAATDPHYLCSTVQDADPLDADHVWDVTGTEFAARHAHYEQFYQGAPHVYLNQLAGTPVATAMSEYAGTALTTPLTVTR
ncbi:4-hydroxyphenylacetate 3-hydroxylase C-terminal domain-containing protein [Nocardia sp. NPDC058640]|uniref:4-hydroxyphenylacetate 3-hydroxylase C-terminal domain-containing protein n=1 Tax=Nocardia sp. NPDC058640 TaxID=3346571 RepID=UPI003655C830